MKFENKEDDTNKTWSSFNNMPRVLFLREVESTCFAEGSCKQNTKNQESMMILWQGK
jgi:hypothetical protein